MTVKQTIHAEFPFTTPEEITQYNNMANYGTFLSAINGIMSELPKMKDVLCEEIKAIKTAEVKGDINSMIADKIILFLTEKFNQILTQNNVTFRNS